MNPQGADPEGARKARRRFLGWALAIAVAGGLAGTGVTLFSLLSNGSGQVARTPPYPSVHAAPPTGMPKWTPPPTGDYQIVFASGRSGRYHLSVINPDGTGETTLTAGRGQERTPAWSPRRDLIAFAASQVPGDTAEMDIYIMRADGTGIVRLTRGPQNDEDPSWSPDETRVVFTSSDRTTGRTRIRIVGIDGARGRQLPQPPAGCIDREPAWSPDGVTIAFARACGKEPSRLFVIHTDGKGLHQLADFGRTPDWAPDGSKLAYTGWGREGPAIFFINADGTGRQLFTTDGSGDPAWSPDGSRIAFIANEVAALKLFVINVDGTNQRPLILGTSNEVMPSW